MKKMQDTIMCPTCGRGYPGKFWPRTKPKPWRLGVKQDPGQAFKVLGEIRSPGDLENKAVFDVLRSRMLEGVASWVFHDWLDVREVLKRVADLGRVVGRKVWHQFIEVPASVHRVEHGIGWGKATGVDVARIEH